MDHFPTSWGRPRNEAYDAYNTFPLHQKPYYGQDAFTDSVQRTQQPIVTGTSTLAIKYKDGIMMAADNLASYGSLARFRDVQRLHTVGSYTVIAASGDMSDFQQIQHMLDEVLINEEVTRDDDHKLGPAEIHEYLSQVMYAMRSKFDPLWNSILVGGFKDGKRYEYRCSYVDLLGVTYTASTMATGYGAYIAQPLLRRAVEGREDQLTEEEARKIIEQSMRVLFYRDARSLNKFQIATITAEGATISDPITLDTEWAFAEGIRGYGAQTQHLDTADFHDFKAVIPIVHIFVSLGFTSLEFHSAFPHSSPQKSKNTTVNCRKPAADPLHAIDGAISTSFS
ncbi:hypothetical protein EW145_g5646 [Phellinidium pouzarii]|uniref:Proteasome subunit beta n=1 Tax=Phellinidium pouzarii TaxID=167371 RepID=A0A4S4KZA2_9AGAM|nr:hypothetical protein EW145_g5646 [Phellinidium pouzarii]